MIVFFSHITKLEKIELFKLASIKTRKTNVVRLVPI